MYPELFYSKVGGHPQQRRHLDPRPLLYRNQIVDALRRSVRPDDVGVSGTRDLKNQCTPQSESEVSFLLGSDHHPEVFL